MKRSLTLLWQVSTIALLCAAMITQTACTVDEVLSTIDAALQTAAGLEVAVGAVSPADAAALRLLTGLAEKGIGGIQVAYDTYEKNKTNSNLQNVMVAAQAIQTNLPQELVAVRIQNPNAVQKATAWVNLVSEAVGGVITVVDAAQQPSQQQPRMMAMAHAAPAILTAASVQQRWQTDVCQGDTTCGALVVPHHKHARR